MKADMVVFSGSSHPRLAGAIAEKLGIPLGKSSVIRFSNENLMVRLQDNVREKDVFVVQTSSTPVNENLVELLIFIDALKYASAARITAVLPYFPYCRSDKKDEPRISIAARLMADLIQAAGAHRVLTMDLHSPQIQGFFRIPADQLLAAPVFFDYFENVLFKEAPKSDFVLVMGDHGAAKQFAYYFDEVDLPVAIMDKFRVDHTEKPVIRQVIGDVAGKQCLIIDDEVASGGTLIEAAHCLKAAGAKRILAAAVHPILSGNAVQKLVDSPIERFILGNTVPVNEKIEQHPERFTVLNLAGLFANAIERIHTGESVAELFPPSVRRKA
jgi:ribose-phosphate pyrophosphokinase